MCKLGIVESVGFVASTLAQLAAAIDGTDDFLNSYTYDNLQRLTRVPQETQYGGNTVASKRVDFAYNALGQFTDLDRYASRDTSEFVANTSFTYDLANRLTSLQHGGVARP